MKKILTFLFLIIALSTFAQEKTLNSILIKIKIGQGGQFYAADETWISKDYAIQLALPCFKGLLFFLVIAVQVVGGNNPLLGMIQHSVNYFIHEADL